MSKNVGHWTDDEEMMKDMGDERPIPWGILTFLFVTFVLPWLFGLGAIVGLLFFNGKF